MRSSRLAGVLPPSISYSFPFLFWRERPTEKPFFLPPGTVCGLSAADVVSRLLLLFSLERSCPDTPPPFVQLGKPPGVAGRAFFPPPNAVRQEGAVAAEWYPLLCFGLGKLWAVSQPLFFFFPPEYGRQESRTPLPSPFDKRSIPIHSL